MLNRAWQSSQKIGLALQRALKQRGKSYNANNAQVGSRTGLTKKLTKQRQRLLVLAHDARSKPSRKPPPALVAQTARPTHRASNAGGDAPRAIQLANAAAE